jgi:heme/copper-type cytochrome/quinol oxidase subunit 2
MFKGGCLFRQPFVFLLSASVRAPDHDHLTLTNTRQWLSLRDMDGEQPRSGYFFITVFMVVLIVIVIGIVYYMKRVHNF